MLLKNDESAVRLLEFVTAQVSMVTNPRECKRTRRATIHVKLSVYCSYAALCHTETTARAAHRRADQQMAIISLYIYKDESSSSQCYADCLFVCVNICCTKTATPTVYARDAMESMKSAIEMKSMCSKMPKVNFV